MPALSADPRQTHVLDGEHATAGYRGLVGSSMIDPGFTPQVVL